MGIPEGKCNGNFVGEWTTLVQKSRQNILEDKFEFLFDTNLNRLDCATGHNSIYWSLFLEIWWRLCNSRIQFTRVVFLHVNVYAVTIDLVNVVNLADSICQGRCLFNMRLCSQLRKQFPSRFARV